MTSSRERLYAVSCAAMFVFGTILGLPGTVLGQAETIAQFGLTLADRGLLISTLFVGLLFGSLVSGPLVDALGQRAALAASSALVAVCLPFFAMASSGPMAALALAACGLASATINTASNALSSELFPDERARRMNGIAVMVGVGGLAMPTATVLASDFVSWRAVVIGAAVLSAVVALAAARMPAVHLQEPARDSALTALRQFSRQPGFIWFCLLILLGGGNEASMAGWTTGFLLASGFDSTIATTVLSSHWLGLILSRVIFSSRIDRSKAVAIERSAVLTVLLLLVWITATRPAVVLAGPFVLGLSIALVMPTGLALAGERLQGNPGMLFGGLLTLAQVGGMVLPTLVGVIAEEWGIRTGIAVLVVSSGAIVLGVRRATSSPEA